jgi:hypothetical protein
MRAGSGSKPMHPVEACEKAGSFKAKPLSAQENSTRPMPKTAMKSAIIVGCA